MSDEDINVDPNPDVSEGDPAEFLLLNSKYHDCHLTVGNPETEDVERIGVSSTHLIAHSPVFRDMLADSKLADPSGANTHIKDVSPATFKLMLRYVYGGKLPKMTPEEAADLALCADKYNVQRLVGKAAKRLKPTSAEDVFPALMVVMYIKFPVLELQVSKIIQQKTDKIIQNKNFLELDENCILFIVKQSTFNISELELWNNLVLWGESQVQKHPEKTLRDCLSNVLPYVRLLVLTVEEIAKHVFPSKILTSEELMDLTLAVTNKQIVQMPGLCNNQEKRVIYGSNIFKPDKCIVNGILTEQAPKEHSTLTIETTKSIKIETFMFKSFKIEPNVDYYLGSSNLTCTIEICSSSKGLVTTRDVIKVSEIAVPSHTVTFHVKKSNGEPLNLVANKLYLLKITTYPPLPVHKLGNGGYRDFTNCTLDGLGMKVTFKDPFHIMEIVYRVQE